ncbi:MAG: TIR domain-containing protein, partial [Anaerolineae bacterium]|nr:TIR domain-containing protein [Anaerolineae bacterium]
MPHIFLSYAHADADRLYPVHARMQAVLAHNLWIDKVGLRTGVEWLNAIKRAVDESYGVIFAITETFVSRPFILEKEIPWTIDRFKDTQGPVIFVVRFDDVPFPKVLQDALDDKDLKYLFQVVDARDKDEKRWFTELKLPEPPKEKDKRFLLDWPRLLTFQGRDEQLVQLHETLMGGKNVSVSALHGLGGIGKTQLAVEYAHRYRFHYPAGVYWVNAARPDWTGEISALAQNLGLKPADPNAPDYNRQMVTAFNNFLRDQAGEALVILDNVENPADVANREIGPALRPIGLAARLLITTRRADLPERFARIPMNVLPLPDARALILTARPEAETDPAVDKICNAVGCLPLALGLAAAALKKRPTVTPTALLDHLLQSGVDTVAQKIKLSPGELGTQADYNISLTAALDWHWGQIADHAQTVIALAAAYDEAAEVPLARLRILSGLEDDPAALDQPFTEALDELKNANLIEDLGAALRLHPLVREDVRKRADIQKMMMAGRERLANAYHTPAILNREAAARDSTAVLRDMQDTLRLKTPTLYSDHLVTLARYLEWENHHLRNWKPDENPAYFIQQVRERVHHQGNDRLRDFLDDWLNHHLHFRTADQWHFPNDPALIRVFEGHTDSVSGVAVLGDGRALSASYDQTLRLWNLKTGESLRVFEGHTDSVNAVAVLGDGRALSASGDNTLRLWDVESGESLRVFEGHTDGVTAVAVLGDG